MRKVHRLKASIFETITPLLTLGEIISASVFFNWFRLLSLQFKFCSRAVKNVAMFPMVMGSLDPKELSVISVLL